MLQRSASQRMGWPAALLLCGIAAVAAYLRLAQLGTPSFWVDELNFVYAGKSLAAGETPRFPSGNPNQRALLYAECVAQSFRWLGVSEMSARLPSAVFGVLAIFAVFFVARHWFGRNVGLLSAFLLTFSHFAIGWSRLSRMYTLFQLLYLLGAYAVYKGLANPAAVPGPAAAGRGWHGLSSWFSAQGVRWSWLLSGAAVLLVSLQVHELTGIFAASLLAFVAGSLLISVHREGVAAALRSQYGLAMGLALLATVAGILWFDLPGFVRRALEFHPAWARYALVQDTHYYYYFLTESSQFPLAAFFLLGSAQMLTRMDRTAFYVFCNFAVPVVLHSFVFAYKVPNYIFQIYPFFLMLAAYALHNLWRVEVGRLRARRQTGRSRISPSLQRLLVAIVILGWLPFTLWFRYAWKLPFMGAAGHNGAVDYEDWRGAAAYALSDTTADQVLVSTLPLTVLYYTGRADYNLNLANSDEALDWQVVPANGERSDFYSGAEAISTLDDLQQVLARHPAALFILDTYRLERAQYVPPEVAAYIKSHLPRVWADARNTVQIFAWRAAPGVYSTAGMRATQALPHHSKPPDSEATFASSRN